MGSIPVLGIHFSQTLFFVGFNSYLFIFIGLFIIELAVILDFFFGLTVYNRTVVYKRQTFFNPNKLNGLSYPYLLGKSICRLRGARCIFFFFFFFFSFLFYL